MIRATLGENTPLAAQASEGDTNLYCRATIYSAIGTIITTVDIAHLGNGLYGNNYTFNTEGYYHVVYKFYTDSGYTIESDYTITAETYEANSDKSNIVRLLGLTHDNVSIDGHTYDSFGNLLTSRVRHYASKAQAEAAGTSGLLATWSVVATYSAGKLQTYRLVREP